MPLIDTILYSKEDDEIATVRDNFSEKLKNVITQIRHSRKFVFGHNNRTGKQSNDKLIVVWERNENGKSFINICKFNIL